MPTQKQRHARRHAEEAAANAGGDDEFRLDKWLWAARFYKTRALAHAAVESGRVKREGAACKPSHVVRLGERYAIVRDGLTWSVTVTGLTDRRGSAGTAAEMYSEAEESIAARIEIIERNRQARAASPMFRGRPTKRQRRKIEDFLAEP